LWIKKVYFHCIVILVLVKMLWKQILMKFYGMQFLQIHISKQHYKMPVLKRLLSRLRCMLGLLNLGYQEPIAHPVRCTFVCLNLLLLMLLKNKSIFCLNLEKVVKMKIMDGLIFNLTIMSHLWDCWVFYL